jgi:hypothetical protein
VKEAPIQLTEHEYRVVIAALLHYRFDEDIQLLNREGEVGSLITKIACRFELDQTEEEARVDFNKTVPRAG